MAEHQPPSRRAARAALRYPTGLPPRPALVRSKASSPSLRLDRWLRRAILLGHRPSSASTASDLGSIAGRGLVQRQDDPKKAMAAMEKALARAREEEDRESSVVLDPLVAARMAALAACVTEPTKRKEEQKPKESVSMTAESRMGAYYARVRVIEGLKEQLQPEDLVGHLYSACNVLLPELGEAFPRLKLTADGPEGALSPRQWQLEIKVPHVIELRLAPDLKELSATLFHETRHAEQLWMEVAIRAGRDESTSTIAEATGLTKETVEMLRKIPLPANAATGHMKPLLKLTKREVLQHKQLKQDFLAISSNLSGARLAASLGKPPSNLRKLEARGAQLEQLYRSIPDEADAYTAEAAYRQLYEVKTWLEEFQRQITTKS